MAQCGVVDAGEPERVPYYPETTPKTLPGAPPGFEIREGGMWVTQIPKGTLLFRGVKIMRDLMQDVAGVATDSEGETTKFCCTPNHWVYFYPTPYADWIVADYKKYAIYVTTRDLEVACLILPSPRTRGDRNTPGSALISCDKITPLGCELEGRKYDACLQPSFQAKNPDVVGMLGIAEGDRRVYTANRQFFPYGMPEYVDASEPKMGAIPEIVLNPFRRALRKQVTHSMKGVHDLERHMKELAPELNFKLFYLMMNREDKAIAAFMKAICSPEGFEQGGQRWHAKVNKETGFYQIVEMSDSFPMTDDPHFQGPPFRFVRPPPTGTSRTLRRRGHRGKTRRHRI